MSELAPHDWFVVGFMALLVVAGLTATPGPAQQRATAQLAIIGTLCSLGIVAVRANFLRPPLARALVYRTSMFLPVASSYFILGSLLPLVNPGSLDRELYAVDLTLFGVEPSLAFDSVVNPWSTEWFAFFYFAYFFVILVHILTVFVFSRRQRVLGEFATGLILCYCVGHVVYMIVPGFGPFRALASAFSNDLVGGQWMDMVMTAVTSGGAQKDIFPSLHTAAPTFIALFAHRHRHLIPFRATWPVIGFIALNIVLATMFLRWHYVIDVVAGLVLAGAAAEIAARVTHRECERRQARGLQPAWP